MVVGEWQARSKCWSAETGRDEQDRTRQDKTRLAGKAVREHANLDDQNNGEGPVGQRTTDWEREPWFAIMYSIYLWCTPRSANIPLDIDAPRGRDADRCPACLQDMVLVQGRKAVSTAGWLLGHLIPSLQLESARKKGGSGQTGAESQHHHPFWRPRLPAFVHLLYMATIICTESRGR